MWEHEKFSAWWFSWYAAGRAENATTNHQRKRRRRWTAGTRATGQRQAKVDIRGDGGLQQKSQRLHAGRGRQTWMVDDAAATDNTTTNHHLEHQKRLCCLFLFSGILFWTPKTRSCQDSRGFLFSTFSGGISSQECGFGGVLKFLFSAAFTGIYRRNSCGTGIPVFAQDSSGFLRIPAPAKSCLT